MVAHIKDDYRAADVDTATLAALDFAVKLTRSPGDMVPADLEALRSEGYDDRAIHDIVQVVSYFNYINRIADGLGVDLEPEMPPKPAR